MCYNHHDDESTEPTMSRPFSSFDAKRYTPYPDRVFVAPISLAPVTVSEVTDADVGLPADPVAQRRAEAYVRASLAYRLKQAEKVELESARLARLAGRRILVRLPNPADDIESVEAIPDSAELVLRERFQ